jgi:hypothetical protein
MLQTSKVGRAQFVKSKIETSTIGPGCSLVASCFTMDTMNLKPEKDLETPPWKVNCFWITLQ